MLHKEKSEFWSHKRNLSVNFQTESPKENESNQCFFKEKKKKKLKKQYLTEQITILTTDFVLQFTHNLDSFSSSL